MSLKVKTINSFYWSFIDSISNQGIQFVFGIILARILNPSEIGIIGLLTMFVAISQTFIDSGFTQALIRKKNCTEIDYSTVFYFNIGVSFLFFLIFFFSSEVISIFFNVPKIAQYIPILGIGLIFNSVSIIQKTILTKSLNFKLQTKISCISSVFSAFVSVIMIYSGFGIWSFIYFTLIRFGLVSLLFWLWGKWSPKMVFSFRSFNELFSFGSKLLVSSLIDTTYKNVNYIIIGKFFSPKDLGFYTRADQFQALPSQNLQSIISRVSFPVLATLQNDTVKLKEIYKKLLTSTMLITFVLMLCLAAISNQLIVVVIGDQWFQSVIYLKLLCFVGMLYPLHALNLNMLNVQGRSDLFLRLEIIKKVLAVPSILLGLLFGIKVLIISMIITSFISFFLNSYWSGKFIGYSTYDQIRDILPSLLIAISVNSIVYFLELFINVNVIYLLILQIFVCFLLTIVLCEIIKFKTYLFIKEIITNQISKKWINLINQ